MTEGVAAEGLLVRREQKDHPPDLVVVEIDVSLSVGDGAAERLLDLAPWEGRFDAGAGDGRGPIGQIVRAARRIGADAHDRAVFVRPWRVLESVVDLMPTVVR